MHTELWDLYDSKRSPLGSTVRRGDTLPPGTFHLVVLVWIADSQGRFIISRRHPDKPWPGLWECTGGSALQGEDSRMAALREVAEEIGYRLDPAHGTLVDTYLGYNTIYDVWLFRQDLDLAQAVLQAEEVIAIDKASPETIRQLLADGQMVPTLRSAFETALGVLTA